jgi:hypothetical protein
MIGETLLSDYDRHKIRRERLEFLRPYVASLRPSATTNPTRPGHGMKRRGQAPILPPAVAERGVVRLPVIPS